MPKITVLRANAQIITIPFTESAPIALARKLANSITAAVKAHTLTAYSGLNGPPPPLPPGTVGEFVVQTAAPTLLSPGYDAVVVDFPNSFVLGSGDNGESVLSGTGGLTFLAPAGSGTVVAAGGTNDIVIGPGSTGPWLIATGAGDDTILADGIGNDTIEAGGGHNRVVLGAGNDIVRLSGFDTVSAGAGSTTIDASHARTANIQGGTGNLLFIGSEGAATVTGGTGSLTVFGGEGRLDAQGGSAGNNLLRAGEGAATLSGGGNGDRLYAGGERQVLIAGAGNETLSAAGHDTLYGGSGNTQMVGGRQDNTFVAGTGAATMTGGHGEDIFVFIDGSAGGQDLIAGFHAGDPINLKGYGTGAVQAALKTETVGPNGVTITLSDSTSITFAGLTSLNQSAFVGFAGDHGFNCGGGHD